MFSNTPNNSAKESVNTRPKLKAYLTFIELLKKHQQRAAVLLGYVLVAGLFFGLGKYSTNNSGRAIKIEEPSLDLSRINNSANAPAVQTLPTPTPAAAGSVAGATTSKSPSSDCTGKIKGNISGTSKIYHMPGGAFYDRTNPEMCFDTEAQAQAAGFRKSSR